MFCSECGTKNEKNSLFCENCGTKLENNEVTKKYKKISDKKKPNKITLIIGALVVVIVALYIILSNMFNPSNVATNFFKAVMSADADGIYKYVDVKSDEFTSKKMFRKLIDKNDKVEIINHSVKKVEKSDDGLKTTVTISYVRKDNNQTYTATIVLVKDKSKKLLVFDNWKINMDSYRIVEKFEFRLPKNSKLKIEDIKVDKKYIDSKESSNSLDVYVIPKMFNTNYNIKVTLPIGIEINDKVNTNSSYYTVNFDESNLSDKLKEQLLKTSKDDLQLIYNNGKDKKVWEDIKSNFEYENSDLSKFKKAYETFVNSLSSSSTILTKLEVKDIKISNINLNSNGYLYLSLRFNYDYSISYTSGDETKTKDDSSYDYVYLTYDYVDSKFKLIDITSLNTYFSKY